MEKKNKKAAELGEDSLNAVSGGSYIISGDVANREKALLKRFFAWLFSDDEPSQPEEQAHGSYYGDPTIEEQKKLDAMQDSDVKIL